MSGCVTQTIAAIRGADSGRARRRGSSSNPMSGKLIRLFAAMMAVALGVGGVARAQVSGKDAASQLNLPPPTGVKVATLPAMSPHWVFVEDPISNVTINSISLVDGDSLKTLGMLSGGLESDFAIAPDHKRIYMADTYWSRGTRGTRTDVVTIYDARTLNVTGEVIIPPRQLSIPDHTQADVTPDGRFLLVTNMTPATSVTVVDLASNKFVGKIDTPSCTEVFVTGPRRFSSICGDGSMLTVTMDDSGKAAGTKRAGPFFDPEKDPVFGYPAMVGKIGYFVSYHGVVHPVDLSGPQAQFQATWSLLDTNDKAQHWLPGGWQVYWAYQKRGLSLRPDASGRRMVASRGGSAGLGLRPSSEAARRPHHTGRARRLDHDDPGRQPTALRRHHPHRHAPGLLGAQRALSRHRGAAGAAAMDDVGAVAAAAQRRASILDHLRQIGDPLGAEENQDGFAG
jgi:amicyanin-dependent methylamine dehydrogenase large subunit